MLCERRILEFQPSHALPVTRAQLGSESGGGDRFAVGVGADAAAAAVGKSSGQSKLPSHAVSALAGKQRQFDDLAVKYQSLLSHRFAPRDTAFPWTSAVILPKTDAFACGAAASESRARWAVGETVILLTSPLPLVGVSIVMERGCQQNDSLADG